MCAFLSIWLVSVGFFFTVAALFLHMRNVHTNAAGCGSEEDGRCPAEHIIATQQISPHYKDQEWIPKETPHQTSPPSPAPKLNPRLSSWPLLRQHITSDLHRKFITTFQLETGKSPRQVAIWELFDLAAKISSAFQYDSVIWPLSALHKSASSPDCCLPKSY